MCAAATAAAEIFRIGAEQRPVVVIDDFVDDPQALAAEAATLAFAPMGRFYPGIRAPFDLERMTRMTSPHQDTLRRLFGGAKDYRADDCAFSLVTTPSAQLHALQSIPHVDTTEPYRVAVLVYLSGAQFGGTAFYRHKGTGFEFIDKTRAAAYTAALDSDVARFGAPTPAYMTGDTPMFDMIAAFDAKPGRALIYSVQSLHSGFIRSPERLSDDPKTGRLTLNGFLTAA